MGNKNQNHGIIHRGAALVVLAAGVGVCQERLLVHWRVWMATESAHGMTQGRR